MDYLRIAGAMVLVLCVAVTQVEAQAFTSSFDEVGTFVNR